MSSIWRSSFVALPLSRVFSLFSLTSQVWPSDAAGSWTSNGRSARRRAAAMLLTTTLLISIPIAAQGPQAQPVDPPSSVADQPISPAIQKQLDGKAVESHRAR